MVTKLGIIPGITVEAIAQAILVREFNRVPGLVQEWLRYEEPFTEVPRPDTDDPRVLAVAAAVVEMLAARAGEEPPAWTSEIAGLAEPFFVMERAERPGFTRTLCLTEAPEPLKRRNIFAPPNYLTFA